MVAGHEVADGGASHPGNPAVKQERYLPATSAAQPPALAHNASQGTSAQHNGTRTLGDVIADVTRLEVRASPALFFIQLSLGFRDMDEGFLF